MSHERDYILGTHDDEIARLGLQHRVWRPRVSDAWRRAGFTLGQTLLDVGCGPGHGTIDLAELVGPLGKIIAVDRSQRFLDYLETTRRQRGLDHITTFELELDADELPVKGADGAWCRWIFAFLKQPRDLLARIGRALRPGGVLVAYEYLDYSTWRIAPRSPAHEEFVRVVMESWRADGGEPDIGLDLPRWLEELGFETKTLQPIINIVPASNYVWQWPKAFIEVGLRRLVELGRFTGDRARKISEAFVAAEAASHTLMITPAMLEIIAVRK